MAGVLYARVGSSWVPISSGGGGGTDEVWVGPAAPASADTELWYDTDEPTTLTDDTRWNTAWGVVGQAQIMTAQTGITATSAPGTPITGATVTATTVTGRRYRITFDSYPYSDAANVGIVLTMLRDGVTVQARTVQVIYSGNAVSLLVESFETPAAGSHTWTVGISKNAGSGNVNLYASAANPATLAVEDIGPVTGAVPALMTVTDRWNTAWGIQAQGSLVAADPLTVTTAATLVTSSVPFTTVVGRRYRAALYIRAMQATAANTHLAMKLYDGATSLTTNNTLVYAPVTQFNVVNYAWSLIGDGVARNFNVKVSAGTANINLYQEGAFYIEDIGPISGAVAIPDPTPAWLPLTYSAGWSNQGSAPAQYRKVGDMVQVRFAAKRATAMSLHEGSEICWLPVGYRPGRLLNVMCGTIHKTEAWGMPGMLDVQDNGSVQVYVTEGTTNCAYWSITRCDFQFSVTP